MNNKSNNYKSNTSILIILILILFLMIVLSFASIPLYRAFCQKTGFGGTPKISSLLPTHTINRKIKINFNTDIHKNLPWDFKSLQKELIIKVGELGLAFFQIHNKSSQPIVGIASYNVTPDKVGNYFNKVSCFCFEEQIIAAGQTINIPVQFFIDPKLNNEKQLKDIKSITLSYTFFLAKDFIWSL